MVKIKICGLSRPDDIAIVNREKPDFIGFVFAKSRREVTWPQAAKLREQLAFGIIPVGVFVDEKIEKILSLVQNGVIEMIQLHGFEDERYIQELKALTDKPVIKAIAVECRGDVQKWQDTAADYLLLDHQGGGTGQTFDWNLAGEIKKPYFLAGGLNPENVNIADITAQIAAVPFAVDTSSGVETGGDKDPAKISAFIRRIRNGN